MMSRWAWTLLLHLCAASLGACAVIRSTSRPQADDRGDTAPLTGSGPVQHRSSPAATAGGRRLPSAAARGSEDDAGSDLVRRKLLPPPGTDASRSRPVASVRLDSIGYVPYNSLTLLKQRGPLAADAHLQWPYFATRPADDDGEPGDRAPDGAGTPPASVATEPTAGADGQELVPTAQTRTPPVTAGQRDTAEQQTANAGDRRKAADYTRSTTDGPEHTTDDEKQATVGLLMTTVNRQPTADRQRTTVGHQATTNDQSQVTEAPSEDSMDTVTPGGEPEERTSKLVWTPTSGTMTSGTLDPVPTHSIPQDVSLVQVTAEQMNLTPEEGDADVPPNSHDSLTAVNVSDQAKVLPNSTDQRHSTTVADEDRRREELGPTSPMEVQKAASPAPHSSHSTLVADEDRKGEELGPTTPMVVQKGASPAAQSEDEHGPRMTESDETPKKTIMKTSVPEIVQNDTDTRHRQVPEQVRKPNPVSVYNLANTTATSLLSMHELEEEATFNRVTPTKLNKKVSEQASEANSARVESDTAKVPVTDPLKRTTYAKRNSNETLSSGQPGTVTRNHPPPAAAYTKRTSETLPATKLDLTTSQSLMSNESRHVHRQNLEITKELARFSSPTTQAPPGYKSHTQSPLQQIESLDDIYDYSDYYYEELRLGEDDEPHSEVLPQNPMLQSLKWPYTHYYGDAESHGASTIEAVQTHMALTTPQPQFQDQATSADSEPDKLKGNNDSLNEYLNYLADTKLGAQNDLKGLGFNFTMDENTNTKSNGDDNAVPGSPISPVTEPTEDGTITPAPLLYTYTEFIGYSGETTTPVLSPPQPAEPTTVPPEPYPATGIYSIKLPFPVRNVQSPDERGPAVTAPPQRASSEPRETTRSLSFSRRTEPARPSASLVSLLTRTTPVAPDSGTERSPPTLTVLPVATAIRPERYGGIIETDDTYDSDQRPFAYLVNNRFGDARPPRPAGDWNRPAERPPLPSDATSSPDGGPSSFYLQAVQKQGQTSYSEAVTARPGAATTPLAARPSPVRGSTTGPQRPATSNSAPARPTSPAPRPTQAFTLVSSAETAGSSPVTLRPLSCVTTGSQTVCAPRPGEAPRPGRPRPTIVARPELASQPDTFVLDGGQRPHLTLLDRPLLGGELELDPDETFELPRPQFGHRRPGLVTDGGGTVHFQTLPPAVDAGPTPSRPPSSSSPDVVAPFGGTSPWTSGAHSSQAPGHSVKVTSHGLTVHGASLSSFSRPPSSFRPQVTTPMVPQTSYPHLQHVLSGGGSGASEPVAIKPAYVHSQASDDTGGGDGGVDLHVHSHREPTEQTSYAVANVWKKVSGELKLVAQQLVPIDQVLATKLGDGGLLGADQLPSQLVSQLAGALDLGALRDPALPTSSEPPPTVTTSSYENYEPAQPGQEGVPSAAQAGPAVEPTESSYVSYTSAVSQHHDASDKEERPGQEYGPPAPPTVSPHFFGVTSPPPSVATTPRASTSYYDSLLFKFTERPSLPPRLTTTAAPQATSPTPGAAIFHAQFPHLSPQNVLASLPVHQQQHLGAIPNAILAHSQLETVGEDTHGGKYDLLKPPLLEFANAELTPRPHHLPSSTTEHPVAAAAAPRPTQSSYASYNAPWVSSSERPSVERPAPARQPGPAVDFNNRVTRPLSPEILNIVQEIQAQRPVVGSSQEVIGTVTNASLSMLPAEVVQLLNQIKNTADSGNLTLLSLFGGQQEGNIQVNGANIGVTKGSLGVHVNHLNVSQNRNNNHYGTTPMYTSGRPTVHKPVEQGHAVSGVLDLLQPDRSTTHLYTTKSMFKDPDNDSSNYDDDNDAYASDQRVFGGVGNPSLDRVPDSSVQVSGSPVDQNTQALLLLETPQVKPGDTSAPHAAHSKPYFSLHPVGNSRPVDIESLFQSLPTQGPIAVHRPGNSKPHVGYAGGSASPSQSFHQGGAHDVHAGSYPVELSQAVLAQLLPTQRPKSHMESAAGAAPADAPAAAPVISGASQSALQTLGDRLGIDNPRLLAAILLSVLPTMALAVPVLGRRRRRRSARLELDSLQLLAHDVQAELRDRHPGLFAQFESFGQKLRDELVKADPQRHRTETVQQEPLRFELSEDWKPEYQAGKTVDSAEHAERLVSWLRRVLAVPTDYNNRLRQELLGAGPVAERIERRPALRR